MMRPTEGAVSQRRAKPWLGLLLCAPLATACDDDDAAERPDSTSDGNHSSAGTNDAGTSDAGKGDAGKGDAGSRSSDAGASGNDAGMHGDGGSHVDAGSDGGTTTSDGGGPVGAGSCAGKTYKLCEDFEGSASNNIPAGWSNRDGWASTATYSIATDQAHSGSKSFKNNTTLTGGKRISKALGTLGATASKHWGRLYYRVASPAPVGKNGAYYHVTFAALIGPAAENRVVDTVESPSRKIQYLFNLPDDSCCEGSSYDWSFDGAWHCAEWNLDVASKSYKFFIDGSEVKSIGFTNNAGAKMSNYTDLAIGSMFYVDPDGAITTWIDDVALDDNRIGCTP
ncbi:MAG TPA: hypothetical protein VI299_03130 [Polyangiales bacterium]